MKRSHLTQKNAPEPFSVCLPDQHTERTSSWAGSPFQGLGALQGGRRWENGARGAQPVTYPLMYFGNWALPWRSCPARGQCISGKSRVFFSSGVASHRRVSSLNWPGTRYIWFGQSPCLRSSSSQSSPAYRYAPPAVCGMGEVQCLLHALLVDFGIPWGAHRWRLASTSPGAHNQAQGQGGQQEQWPGHGVLRSGQSSEGRDPVVVSLNYDAFYHLQKNMPKVTYYCWEEHERCVESAKLNPAWMYPIADPWD